MSRDIYIEAEGQKIGVVESYKCQTVREVYPVEEMGSSQPIYAAGKPRYRLELTRVLFTGSMDFHTLTDFSVVIVKPGQRVIYSGCQWEQINEGLTLGEPCVETVTLTAGRRTVQV